VSGLSSRVNSQTEKESKREACHVLETMTSSRSASAAEKKLSWQEWALMATIPFVMMMSAYERQAMAGLLPLLKDTFSLSDTEAASIKSFAAVARGFTFASMWLLGDFLPKKIAFILFMIFWIVLSVGAVLASSEQFWLFVLCHSLASGSAEVFSILATVLQAEHFNGKYLAWAISANSVGESIATLVAAPVNAMFVNSNSGWRLGMAIGPLLVIPFLLLSAIFLRHSKPPSMPHPIALIQNSISIFRIPSFIILAVSSSLSMLYHLNLMFFWPSIRLDATQVYPDVFIGISYPVINTHFLRHLCRNASSNILSAFPDSAAQIATTRTSADLCRHSYSTDVQLHP
ncbi:hypothetical protein PMAYCL1PPCAC_05543, partial [Pristionchus mayeri]